MLVYLAIIQVGGRAIGADVHADEGWATAGNIVEATLIPIALQEPRPVQNWVRIVPIALVLAAAIGASWVNLFDQKADVVLALVIVVCLVGFTEELMFRGVGWSRSGGWA